MKLTHRRFALLLALPFAGLLATACASSLAVTPLPSPDVAELSAQDMVRVMKCAGFTDEQVLDKGGELRNVLAATGAARVTLEDNTEALFAVIDHKIHVTTRLRGSFIYEQATKVCR